MASKKKLEALESGVDAVYAETQLIQIDNINPISSPPNKLPSGSAIGIKLPVTNPILPLVINPPVPTPTNINTTTTASGHTTIISLKAPSNSNNNIIKSTSSNTNNNIIKSTSSNTNNNIIKSTSSNTNNTIKSTSKSNTNQSSGSTNLGLGLGLKSKNGHLEVSHTATITEGSTLITSGNYTDS